MNKTELKRFSNQVSKRDTGKVINGVVDTVGNNIKWCRYKAQLCQIAIRNKNQKYKFHAACQLENKHWLITHIGTSKGMLNGILHDDLNASRRKIKNWKRYDPNQLAFNFGAWYGKPLNARGISEMEAKLNNTSGLVSPASDGMIVLGK